MHIVTDDSQQSLEYIYKAKYLNNMSAEHKAQPIVLKKLQVSSYPELVEVINYNFSRIVNSPLFKGRIGETGDRGLPGFDGYRGNRIMYASLADINATFGSDWSATQNDAGTAKVVDAAAFNEFCSDANKPAFCNILHTDALSYADWVIAPDGKVYWYDASSNDAQWWQFTGLQLLTSDNDNLNVIITQIIEELIKTKYGGAIKSYAAMFNIAADGQPGAEIDNNYSNKHTGALSIGLESVPRYNNVDSSVILLAPSDTQIDGLGNANNKAAKPVVQILGNPYYYYDLTQRTLNRLDADKKNQLPGIDAFPHMLLQNDFNSGLVFGFASDDSHVKSFADLAALWQSYDGIRLRNHFTSAVNELDILSYANLKYDELFLAKGLDAEAKRESFIRAYKFAQLINQSYRIAALSDAGVVTDILTLTKQLLKLAATVDLQLMKLPGASVLGTDATGKVIDMLLGIFKSSDNWSSIIIDGANANKHLPTASAVKKLFNSIFDNFDAHLFEHQYKHVFIDGSNHLAAGIGASNTVLAYDGSGRLTEEAKKSAFNKDFAGSGYASTVSHSDHTHAEYAHKDDLTLPVYVESFDDHVPGTTAMQTLVPLPAYLNMPATVDILLDITVPFIVYGDGYASVKVDLSYKPITSGNATHIDSDKPSTCAVLPACLTTIDTAKTWSELQDACNELHYRAILRNVASSGVWPIYVIATPTFGGSANAVIFEPRVIASVVQYSTGVSTRPEIIVTRSMSLNAAGGSAEIAYQIHNGFTGAAVTAYATESWIHNVQVTDGKITFDYDKTLQTTARTANIVLQYPTADNVAVLLTQSAKEATVINAEPLTINATANGGSFTVNFSIANPIEGETLTVVAEGSGFVGEPIVNMSAGTIQFALDINTATATRNLYLRLSYMTADNVTVSITQAAQGMSTITVEPMNAQLKSTDTQVQFEITVGNPIAGQQLSYAVLDNDGTFTDTNFEYDDNAGKGYLTIECDRNLTTEQRSCSVKFSHINAQDVTAQIVQAAKGVTTINITPASATTDDTAKTLNFNYEIINPIDGESLTAVIVGNPGWLHDITITPSKTTPAIGEISMQVDELSYSDIDAFSRVAAFKCSYNTAQDVSVEVTQELHGIGSMIIEDVNKPFIVR